jgi:hypothetical protein
LAEQRTATKSQLVSDIGRRWSELSEALDRLTEAQMTGIRDAQGWTIKDHIAHLAAWERSAVYLLEGRPRHEALGVDEARYLEGDLDEINKVIYKQTEDLSLAEARAELDKVHALLLDLLAPMTDADLLKSYSHYLPDEPGEDDGRPVYGYIYGNSADHFAEHLGWIRSLVGKST